MSCNTSDIDGDFDKDLKVTEDIFEFENESETDEVVVEEEELEDVECMAKIPCLVFIDEKEDGGEGGVNL